MKAVSLAERFDLFEEADAICTRAWPEFMLHDPVANRHWMTFIEGWKDFQVLLMEGTEIMAIINSIPLRYDGPVEDLPDEGWDWGVEKAVADLAAGTKPNMLFGVQIVIPTEHQGKGLSSLATREMLRLARDHGLGKLIIPVRPNMKCRYPLIPMDDYVGWTNERGEFFDSWLRVHQKAGGRMVKVCHRAMEIRGSIRDWESWTGCAWPGSGMHVVKGALNPVHMDLAADCGTYVEPNVWMVHEAGSQA